MTGPGLPGFLVIGAFKSGTTSLLSYLDQHPAIWVPWLQEPNYFGSPDFTLRADGPDKPARSSGVYGRFRTDTMAQYRGLFAEAGPGQLTGESSPQYLRSPVAHARIRQALPDVKLVAILRHPADRAFSDWSMFRRDGLESEDFGAAVARQPWDGESAGQHYVVTGFYGAQLQPYFETFPRENIQVYLYEDLQRDADELITSLYTWLGVDPSFRPDTSDIRNLSGSPASPVTALAYRMRRRLQPYLKPVVPQRAARLVDRRLSKGLVPMRQDPQVRRSLVELYADDIRLLGELLDRDLSCWLA